MKTTKEKVEVYDTTLRDGTQSEGLSLSLEDKLRIAKRLDEFGVDFIEGGWPGSNPKDVEFFNRAKKLDWKHAKITAFGSTCKAGLKPEDDPQLQTLVAAESPACTIFGKTWTLHVEDVLKISLEENLRMIRESVAYLKKNGRHVIYDAEHFFDGFEANADYALQTLKAAAEGGADTLTLCDTNGGTLPWRVEEIVKKIKSEIPNSSIGIHTHNDSECGVINALSAVKAGARHVQGTINGYGERCGNANLCSVVANLELKMGFECLPKGKLKELYELSHFVAEVANLPPNEHLAYVGKSAFAHKGGVHVSAIRKNADSYQHIEPELVGNKCRVVVSELSGRSNVLSKAEEMGLEVHGELSKLVVDQIKESEAKGFAFEAAEASVMLLVKRQSPDYKPPFKLVDYHVLSGTKYGSQNFSEAAVKLLIDEKEVHSIAEGNGPVSALDAALRKALREIFPSIRDMHLADYKVRVLDGTDGTDSTVRVLIDSRDEHRTWSTVGAGTNIIESSLQALIDSFEYKLVSKFLPG